MFLLYFSIFVIFEGRLFIIFFIFIIFVLRRFSYFIFFTFALPSLDANLAIYINSKGPLEYCQSNPLHVQVHNHKTYVSLDFIIFFHRSFYDSLLRFSTYVRCYVHIRVELWSHPNLLMIYEESFSILLEFFFIAMAMPLMKADRFVNQICIQELQINIFCF